MSSLNHELVRNMIYCQRPDTETHEFEMQLFILHRLTEQTAADNQGDESSSPSSHNRTERQTHLDVNCIIKSSSMFCLGSFCIWQHMFSFVPVFSPLFTHLVHPVLVFIADPALPVFCFCLGEDE